MRIEEVLWRHRNDYKARMKCEGCGHTQIDGGGYADAYYMHNVIPGQTCGKCGESTETLRAALTAATP